MKRILLLILAILCFTPFASGQLVLNGDFEAPAILGAGQSPIAPGTGKALAADPVDSRYSDGILAISTWVNGFTDVGFGAGVRDAGLSRVNFDGSGDTQYAFINNWETRLSQVTSRIVQSGDIYAASILVGLPGFGGEAGRFQLWAGAPSMANPDVFPSTAMLLAEIRVRIYLTHHTDLDIIRA